MRIVEPPPLKLEEKEVRCGKCQALLAYTERDIRTFYGTWQRTGVESSKREDMEYIRCPECDYQIVLRTYTEEY